LRNGDRMGVERDRIFDCGWAGCRATHHLDGCRMRLAVLDRQTQTGPDHSED
jgi:hypothetical protein